MSYSSYLPYLVKDDLKNIPNLIKAIIAELVGTLFLVFIGCGSTVGSADFVRIALAFGLTVFIMACVIGHVSGCHINPAVTIGLLFGRQIGVYKSLMYICAQCIGAIIGSGLLFIFVPISAYYPNDNIGANALQNGVGIGQGIAIEFFITFVLVSVVYATAVDKNNGNTVPAPIAIGISITICHLAAIPLTGSSMNPARTLGVSVIFSSWSHHYVYWVGPILGGIAASFFYQMVLMAPIPLPVEPKEIRKLNQV